MITVALCGNPNVGKTVLFNELTGSNQHVGNFPGVTVEKKEGFYFHKSSKIKLVDLPGIYGFDARSLDEKVSRDFLLDESPDVVINIVNACNLERNLFLTLQLIEMGVNVILVVNMMDEAKKSGLKINLKTLSKFLGTPVYGITAVKGEGIDNLKDGILKYHDKFTKKHNIFLKYEPEIEEKISILEKELLNNKLDDYHLIRWLSVTLLSNDKEIIERIKKIISEKLFYKRFTQFLVSSGEEERIKLSITKEKYDLVSHIVTQSVSESKNDVWAFTDLMDHVFTHDILGWFIFIFLMWIGFRFTYDFGAPFSLLIQKLVDVIANYAGSLISNPILKKFLVEGVIQSVGAILVFFPNIFLLFVFLGLLEDSGYLSRAAFVADRLMSKFGVTGKSLVPILFGFGCNVPAIMSTRSITSFKERIVSILINPFVSCSARFAVYIFMCGIFFKKNAALMISLIYTVNIFIIMLLLILSKKTFLKNNESLFLLEMPPYRKPLIKKVLNYAWYNGKHFIHKAFTVILVAAIIIWILSNFPLNSGINNSYLVRISKFVSPIFKPLGFNWQGTMAIINGVAAKEVVISTFKILSVESHKTLPQFLSSIFDTPSAVAFIVFIMLYVPCVATVYALKLELGKWKFTFLNILFSTCVAYLMAFIIKYIFILMKVVNII